MTQQGFSKALAGGVALDPSNVLLIPEEETRPV